MKTTEQMEHECNRMPIIMAFLKMRDHALALEKELNESRQDRIAGATAAKLLADKLADHDRLIREDGSDDDFIIAHGKLMEEMLAEDAARRKWNARTMPR